MRGTFALDKPDKLEATLAVTTTVEEWRKVAEELRAAGAQHTWPLGDMLRAVDDLIRQAEAKFYAETVPGDGGRA